MLFILIKMQNFQDTGGFVHFFLFFLRQQVCINKQRSLEILQIQLPLLIYI